MNDLIVVDKNKLMEWFKNKEDAKNFNKGKKGNRELYKAHIYRNHDELGDFLYNLGLTFYVTDNVEYVDLDFCEFRFIYSEDVLLSYKGESRSWEIIWELVTSKENKHKILKEAFELGYIKEKEK